MIECISIVFEAVFSDENPNLFVELMEKTLHSVVNIFRTKKKTTVVLLYLVLYECELLQCNFKHCSNEINQKKWHILYTVRLLFAGADVPYDCTRCKPKPRLALNQTHFISHKEQNTSREWKKRNALINLQFEYCSDRGEYIRDLRRRRQQTHLV